MMCELYLNFLISHNRSVPGIFKKQHGGQYGWSGVEQRNEARDRIGTQSSILLAPYKDHGFYSHEMGTHYRVLMCVVT